jgi:hypothetical protein
VTDDLELLTAKQAAQLLHVDPSTFVRMDVWYIPVGKSKRYTVKLLRAWQEERAVKCQEPSDAEPRRYRGNSTSRGARGGRGGTSTSLSEVIDLGKALGLKTKQQRQPTR